jgi:hypothetical protein
MSAPRPAQHNDPNPLFLICWRAGGAVSGDWLAGLLRLLIAALRLYRPCITQVKKDVSKLN